MNTLRNSLRGAWIFLLIMICSCHGSDAKRAELSLSSVLLLEPPGDQIRDMEKAMETVGAEVTSLSRSPVWTNGWEWRKTNNVAVTAETLSKAMENAEWRPIKVGRTWQSQGEDHVGVAWYRRSITWREPFDFTPCITFRAMEDSVHVFADGKLLGGGGGNWGDVVVPITGLPVGEHTLLVRVVNSSPSGDPNRGGLVGDVDLSVILPETPLLRAFDVVVLSSRFLLSWSSAFALQEYVRLGGVLLVLFHDEADIWKNLPIEQVLPTHLGYPWASVGLVRPVSASPLADGLDLADIEPFELNAGIELPTHAKFARPGTHETKRWNLSPLAHGHTVLMRGNDPNESPLLTSCSYGEGRVFACAGPQLLTLSAAGPILNHLIEQTITQPVVPTAPMAKVWGTGAIPWDKIAFMGLEPCDKEDADLLILGTVDEENEATIRQAISSKRSILALQPDIFRNQPELDPWMPESTPFLPPRPLTSAANWQNAIQDSRPHTIPISLPRDVAISQLCIENRRFGPVRALWSEENLGKQNSDGSWVLTGHSPKGVKVGVWGLGDDKIPIMHIGDRAILVTGTGFRLDLPLPRPFAKVTKETSLWSWEDGLPALATTKFKGSIIASPSVPLIVHDPRNFNWNDVQGSKNRYLHEDTSQLIAWMAREIGAGKHLLPGDFRPCSEGVRITIRSEVATPCSVVSRFRFRDWQRSLIKSDDLSLVLEPGEPKEILLPWPDEDDLHAYREAKTGDFFWLELAILSNRGDRCLAWAEKKVLRNEHVIRIWHSPAQLREPIQKPATWPRFDEESFPKGWSPASQYPLFFPGESIDLYVEKFGSGENLEVHLRNISSGSSRKLESKVGRRSPSPWRVEKWSISPPDSFAVFRVDASVDHVTSSRSFFVANPQSGWTNVHSYKHKGVQVLGTMFPHMNALEFAKENLAADADRGLAWGPFHETWPGQPWCNFHPNPFCYLPNGVHYREWLAPEVRNLSRHVWTGERMVISASVVDGFNGSPWPAAEIHPQHLSIFRTWIGKHHEIDITDVSVDSLAALAIGDLDPYWRLFVATQIALPAHKAFREELKTPSPLSQVTDQFDLPQLPTLLKIPEITTFSSEWQSLFDISSMDPWNIRAGRGFHASTYLVCLGKALAPESKLGHYHMEMLGGDGPERISKIERIRRQNLDVFWMTACASDGSWIPVLDFPNGGGVSWVGGWETWLGLCSRGIRGGHVSFPEDYWGLQQLYSVGEILRPNRPRGFVMAAIGPMLPEPGGIQLVVGDQARLFGILRNEGLPISAIARLDMLSRKSLPDGLILTVPGPLKENEKRALSACLQADVAVGLIACGLTDELLSQYTGIPLKKVTTGEVVVLRFGNLRGPFWDEGTVENYAELSTFVLALKARCNFGVSLPRGVAWYAFDTDQGLGIVLENISGAPKTIPLDLASEIHPVSAIELLEADNLELEPQDTGFRITIPLSATGVSAILVEQA